MRLKGVLFVDDQNQVLDMDIPFIEQSTRPDSSILTRKPVPQSAAAPSRHVPNIAPKRLPTTTDTEIGLVFVGSVYLGLGAAGIHFLRTGGHSWAGSINTLTWVLAVLGAVFTVLSRTLFAQCQSAGLQLISKRAIRGTVLVSDMHKMDIGVHGPIMKLFNRASWPWGWLYKVCLPALAILTSIAFKKAFDQSIKDIPFTITGGDVATIDPIDTASGIRGTNVGGAIVYNITRFMDPVQTSWIYMLANRSDETGLETVAFYMPNLPKLVAAGYSGYRNYSAGSVSTLVAEVQCSSPYYKITNPQGGIINDNNNITFTSMTDGRALIQVLTATNIGWSCISALGTTSGTFSFSSDGYGNWNISSVADLEVTTPIAYNTTPARWNGMAILISDALGTAARYSGWDWNTSTMKSTGYSMMLVGTRISFAATTLITCPKRAPNGGEITAGLAYQLQEQVVLHANWALYITTILLLLQWIIAWLHLICLGEFQIDFGILQIMEMRAAAAETPIVGREHMQPTTTDHGIPLQGHCSKYRTDLVDNRNVAIRTSANQERLHLALVWSQDGLTTRAPWDQRVSAQHYL